MFVSDYESLVGQNEGGGEGRSVSSSQSCYGLVSFSWISARKIAYITR